MEIKLYNYFYKSFKQFKEYTAFWKVGYAL